MVNHDGLARQEGVSLPLLRDQQRALHAYDAVGKVPPTARAEYEIVVKDLGSNILRCGLAAALATLERRKNEQGRILLDHLAGAGVPGLGRVSGDDLAAHVRRLDVDGYLLATREILQVATWLKRAAQAIF